MFVAVRLESDGKIYIDKNIYCRTKEIVNDEGTVEKTSIPLFTDEELTQPPYNYTKVEIDDIYSDCVGSDFDDDLTFSVEKYNARKNKIIFTEELDNLVLWFDNYYRCQIEQYQRCQRDGTEYDKDIVELDKQATFNQNRIRELKKYLSDTEEQYATNKEFEQERVSEEFESRNEIW